MNREQQVLRAKDGDREAFVELMRELEQGMHGTARAMVKKDEDIADALQETILKAYRSLDTLREPGFFKTWIYRILINECNNILKKRGRNVVMDELPESRAISGADDSVELRMAVDQLEEPQRIAVVLYYFQDMPLKEVAETLQLSESAVKTRLYRARKRLLEELQSTEEGKPNYESL